MNYLLYTLEKFSTEISITLLFIKVDILMQGYLYVMTITTFNEIHIK